MARIILVVVAMLSVGMVLQLLVVSRFQAAASQRTAFDAVRAELALGTAPTGPTTVDGEQVSVGTPIAFLEVPEIGLRQVVLEGTTSGTLFSGPGHRRDTVFPGQIGTSVLMGRHAAYGGAFKRIGDLEAGDQIRVTTGQGEFTYEVIGVRRGGDPVPPPITQGEGRLMLMSADGPAFFPNGIIRVDAAATTAPAVGPRPLYTSATLPEREQAMKGDTRTLWVLLLWLQACVAVALIAVWAWHRWGRAQAWIVCLPVLILVGLGAAGELAQLLPNLL